MDGVGNESFEARLCPEEIKFKVSTIREEIFKFLTDSGISLKEFFIPVSSIKFLPEKNFTESTALEDYLIVVDFTASGVAAEFAVCKLYIVFKSINDILEFKNYRFFLG